MEEFIVNDTDELFEEYRTDIKLISRAYANGFNAKDVVKQMPPKEDLVLYEESLFKFAKNWNVEYSDYLTLLYGFETPEKYRNAWQFKINQWNRVFKRCVKGDRITDKNIEVIAEAKNHFPKWDKMVAAAKKAGAFVDNQEEEDEA